MALGRLEAEGHLLRGDVRPGGTERDWCAPEVLRRLKRASLARLRRAVAPVEARALGTFLPPWQGVGEAGPRALEAAVARLEGLPLPWSVLSEAVLPARVPELRPQALDMLAASGAVVWVGAGALGPTDGRVILFRRASLRRLLVPPPLAAETPTEQAVSEALERGGATFLVDLEGAVRRVRPGLSRSDFEATLWTLVWRGLITNDSFAPLRALGAPARRAAGPGWSLAGGRWSLVRDRVDASVSETERALGRAEMLLERYGVLSREAAVAEGLPGGFGPLYRVLRLLEEAGRVRRGYFVEGLSGAQFALPGAVERLRAVRPDPDAIAPAGPAEVRVLAAVDPANPYGALVPWPAPAAGCEARPRRVAGARVVLVRGEVLVYASPDGRHLLTFGAAEADAATLPLAFAAVATLPRAGRRRPATVEQVDGVPVTQSRHRALLLAAGFEPDYRGLRPGLPR